MTTTRVTESQLQRSFLGYVLQNRQETARHSADISSGLKARLPGDSAAAGSIALQRQNVSRIDEHLKRVQDVKSFLNFQDETLRQAGDVMLRAAELAEQGANETNSPARRQEIAGEVFKMRDSLVSLANAQFRGRYVFGGADDADPPYDLASPYTNPTTGGEASYRYVFDAGTGSSTTRTVQVADGVDIRLNTSGDGIFTEGIYAIERLGRALAGYRTDPDSGAPTVAGTAYTMPGDFNEQTQDIQNALNLIKDSRQGDIMTEEIDVAGRLARVDSAESLLNASKVNIEEILNSLQATDLIQSATDLTQAQNALEASLSISSKILTQSILDYL